MKTLGIIALLFAAAPVSAGEPQVFLNGVNIDGVNNKVFYNAKVQIDAKGNIYITTGEGAAAPDTRTASANPAVEEGKPPTRRYWLVTEKAAPGMSQYDVDLFVNGKWIRRFLDREDHVVMEITKHLTTGKNTLHFVAKKNMGNARRSTSPQHYFRIVVGEGSKGGRNVMISRKLVDYKRTALETDSFKDAYTITVY